MNEVLRNEKGQLLPGQKLNPSGRPKQDSIKKKLREAFPEDFLQYIMMRLMLGCPIKIESNEEALKLIKDKEFKKSFRKYSKHFDQDNSNIKPLSAKDTLTLVNSIMDRLYGKPIQSVEQTNINHNIDNDITIEFIKAEGKQDSNE